jgi:hypothetical protein
VRNRKKRTLTAAEKRVFASAGLMVVRYRPDGARATVRELVPESDGRPRSFVQRLADDRTARRRGGLESWTTERTANWTGS